MIHHMRSAVSLEMGYIFSDLMGMRDKENLSFCSLEEKETQVNLFKPGLSTPLYLLIVSNIIAYLLCPFIFLFLPTPLPIT